MERQIIVRIKKRNSESLVDNNKTKYEQKQSEYKPLKSGWFMLDLQEGWREFISSHDFDLFVTLTFQDEIKPETSKKRFEKWIRSLSIKLFGWRYEQKGLGIRYAVVYEYQKRGVLHIHALLGAKGLKDIDREYLAKLWKNNGQLDKETGTPVERVVNGHAKIELYDPARGAIRYMTKHISKGVEPDIFVPRKER